MCQLPAYVQGGPGRPGGWPSCQMVCGPLPCGPYGKILIKIFVKITSIYSKNTKLIVETIGVNSQFSLTMLLKHYPDLLCYFYLLLDKYWPILSWLFHNRRCRASTLPSLMKDRLWFTESLGGESDAISKKNLPK